MFTVKVGDEVGVYRSTRNGSLLGADFATVTKINCHGHIKLSNGKVFDKHGDERGAVFGARLIEAARLRKDQAAEAAIRDTNSKVKELISILNGTFSYSGRAFIDETIKAELMALVAAL
jgi:hypothetical protein